MPDLLILLDCREEPITPFTYSAGSTTPKRQTQNISSPAERDGETLQRICFKIFPIFLPAPRLFFSLNLWRLIWSCCCAAESAYRMVRWGRAYLFSWLLFLWRISLRAGGQGCESLLGSLEWFGCGAPFPLSQLPGGLDHFSRLSSASILTGSFSMGGTVPSSFRAASYPQDNFFIWSCP